GIRRRPRRRHLLVLRLQACLGSTFWGRRTSRIGGRMERDFDAAIIGGGHNGLVAAWYLRQAGLRVGVFERRNFVGGAVVTEELWPGYRVPTCSYICYLLQDRIIEDMALRAHGFDVHQLNPSSFTPFPDGRAMLSWKETER